MFGNNYSRGLIFFREVPITKRRQEVGMDSISSISALSGIMLAQQATKAEAVAALALLQSAMEVQQAVTAAVTGMSDSSVDIYV